MLCSSRSARVEDLSPSAIVALILVATFVFQPIRNWIQEQLDRYIFYRDQYDYRRTWSSSPAS